MFQNNTKHAIITSSIIKSYNDGKLDQWSAIWLLKYIRGRTFVFVPGHLHNAISNSNLEMPLFLTEGNRYGVSVYIGFIDQNVSKLLLEMFPRTEEGMHGLYGYIEFPRVFISSEEDIKEELNVNWLTTKFILQNRLPPVEPHSAIIKSWPGVKS